MWHKKITSSDVCVFGFSYIKSDYIANDEFKFVLQNSAHMVAKYRKHSDITRTFLYGVSCGADLMILLMLLLLLVYCTVVD